MCCTCTDLIIENIGGMFYLEYGTFRLRWDEESTWLITIEAPAGSLSARGLCGNYDADPHSQYICSLIRSPATPLDGQITIM